MGREEGEQCRSKRHCFGFFFFKEKKCNSEEERKKKLGVTQKWVMTKMFFVINDLIF
jgi:hypothetical protein